MKRPDTVKNITDSSWLHSADADVAVPFELTLDEKGAVCCCYPEAEALTDEFLSLFGESEKTLFSDEALLWLNERFEAFLEGYGFELSPDADDYYVNYTLSDAPDVSCPNVVRLRGDENYIDLTDTDIDGLLDCGFIIYAAVVDGNIAALANTGEPINGDTATAVEIGVDTATEYRRRGYGNACVCALVKELAALGHTAIYECASKNLPSIKLIEGIGGTLSYKKIYMVGFRAE